MNCREAAERITALVDGELSPAEREETERHVAGCPSCREALAAEKALAERLRAAPRPALPAGFSASVMAKVGGAPAAAAPPRGRILPMWPMFAAGAAVAAAVVAMVMIGPGDRYASGPEGTAVAVQRPMPMEPKATASRDSNSAVPADEARKSAEGAFETDETSKAAHEEAAGKDAGPPAAAAKKAVAAEAAPPPVMGPETLDKERGEAKAGAREREKAQPGGKYAGPAGEDKRKDDRAASATTRVSMQFNVPAVPEAQQSVEGALVANAGLAIREAPWKQAEAAGESRILLLRVRADNLPKLQVALEAARGMKDSTFELIERGEVLPPEVTRLVDESRARQQLGFLADDSKEGARKAPAPAEPAPAPVPDPAPEQGFVGAGGGGGRAGANRGGEPEVGPPPKPTPAQLKRLAEAPTPAKSVPTTAGAPASEGGTVAEVLVEVRLDPAPPPGGNK